METMGDGSTQRMSLHGRGVDMNSLKSDVPEEEDNP